MAQAIEQPTVIENRHVEVDGKVVEDTTTVNGAQQNNDGKLADAQARADSDVAELDAYVSGKGSPTDAGDSSLGDTTRSTR